MWNVGQVSENYQPPKIPGVGAVFVALTKSLLDDSENFQN